MKSLLTVLALSSFVLTSQAQTFAGKITGNISDDAHKPIESASVSLLKATDSALVKIEVSDKNGRFMPSGRLKQGKYLVSVSSVGHATFYSKPRYSKYHPDTIIYYS